MANTYKVTLRQQLLVAAPCYFKYIALFVILKYVFLYDLSKSGFLWMFVVLFLVDFLPALMLHVQYLLFNSKSKLAIDRSEKIVICEKEHNITKSSFDDIILFKYVASYGSGKSTGWYSFGDYRYCEIGLKDGSSFIVTCLMVNDIQNTLEMDLGINVEKKLRVFAYIKKSEGYALI